MGSEVAITAQELLDHGAELFRRVPRLEHLRRLTPPAPRAGGRGRIVYSSTYMDSTGWISQDVVVFRPFAAAGPTSPGLWLPLKNSEPVIVTGMGGSSTMYLEETGATPSKMSRKVSRM